MEKRFWTSSLVYSVMTASEGFAFCLWKAHRAHGAHRTCEGSDLYLVVWRSHSRMKSPSPLIPSLFQVRHEPEQAVEVCVVQAAEGLCFASAGQVDSRCKNSAHSCPQQQQSCFWILSDLWVIVQTIATSLSFAKLLRPGLHGVGAQQPGGAKQQLGRGHDLLQGILLPSSSGLKSGFFSNSSDQILLVSSCPLIGMDFLLQSSPKQFNRLDLWQIFFFLHKQDFFIIQKVWDNLGMMCQDPV